MLLVRLLGELEVVAGGRPIDPPASSRVRALLAWLAMHPGEHSRGSVAARFWPDVLDSSARASLRSSAWALRRALGAEAGALAGSRERIGLRCETDLAEFEARLAAGALEAAVALCRGPLLAGLEDDWVLEARDAHAEQLGGALARLAAGAGTPREAVGWARRRLELDPLDEEAARDLMRRLVDAGDRSGALAVADRLAHRLRTTLGLAPSSETRALAASVRAGDAPSPTAPARPWAAAGAIVGRAAELTALEALWDGCRAGRGALAVLGGEGGIGKTRLAEEVLGRARAAGAAGAACAAPDLEGAPPFVLWAELLAHLAGGLDPPEEAATWPEELARLAPALPRRLGRTTGEAADVPPDLARARLFEAAVELTEHATSRRPLVLVFDDVHLADAPSLDLVAYVARRIAELPVMLVLTRRGVPRRDAVDGLLHGARGRGVACEEIEVEPLARAEVERLVASVATLGTLEREHVIAAADGNPLLALESARAAARGDRGPPASLRATVRVAVGRLPAGARRTAELAAVAGRDLERGELLALADPGSVAGALDSGLFHSAAGRFGYRHALLRDAVRADLEDGRLRELHEALGAAAGTRPAEAARHLELAGRPDLAVGRLLAAAAEARRTTAVQAAVGFLRRAVELAPDAPEPRLELAEAAAALGDRATAAAELDGALARIPAGDAVRRAAAHARAARWFRGSLCDPTAAGEAARRGLEVLDPRAPDARDLGAELLAVRAWSEVTVTGAHAAAGSVRELERLTAEATPTQRHDLDTVRAYIALALGRLGEAEELLVGMGMSGDRIGRADMAYGGWANAAVVAAAAGAPERALEHAERGLRGTGGSPVIEYQMLAVRASALARLGRHVEARADSDRQAELAARLARPELAALTDHDAGLLALLAGDDERAERLLGRALEADPVVVRAEARLRRAEALARLGRPDEADAEIRAATGEPVRPGHRPAVLVARMAFAQGLSARARGDPALAAARLEESAGHWRRLAAGGSRTGDHLASLVDLGRPPMTGVVEPERELERVDAALRELRPVST